MWERTADTQMEVGILALKRHQENLGIVKRVRERSRNARVFAVASHEDEVAELIDAGAEAARVVSVKIVGYNLGRGLQLKL